MSFFKNLFSRRKAENPDMSEGEFTPDKPAEKENFPKSAEENSPSEQTAETEEKNVPAADNEDKDSSDEALEIMRAYMAFSKKNSAEREKRKRADYAEYLKENGREDLADMIQDVRRNVIPITGKAVPDEEIPIGASKSGGYPDLPPEIPYPTLSGFTAEFVNNTERHPESAMQLAAQINLSETAPYDKDGLLPQSGMLYIFWSGELDLNDAEGWAKYTFDGENKDTFKVLYYGGDLSALKRTAPPCPYHAKYFDKPIESVRYAFDDCRNEYNVREYEEELADLYEEAEEFISDGSKLFGYPKGSMNVDGLARNEVNLFQFDFHEGCIWGLYWYIDKQALADRDFGKARMVWDMD